MSHFIARRLVLTLITLVIVSMVVFASARLLPGDVGRTILGQYATPEQVEQVNRDLGLDRSLPVQYLDWVSDFVRGDWGESYTLDVPVRPLVLSRFWHSLALGAFAFLLTVPLSIFFGVLAARRQGRFADRAISIFGLSFIALPEFVTGIGLIVLFAIELRWFPVASTMPTDFVDVFRQFLLPSIPIMLVLFGYISRMTRAGIIEALESDYTRTATLKGIPQRTIIWRHVLRNGLLPTITVVAVQIGYIVGGLTVVETLFNYPGIGLLVVQSAVQHDLPTLEACVLLIALLYMVANLVADILYGVLNPRIRVATA